MSKSFSRTFGFAILIGFLFSPHSGRAEVQESAVMQLTTPLLAQRADPSDPAFQGPDVEPPKPLPENLEPVLPEPETTPAKPPVEQPDAPTFLVTQIEVLGNTVLAQSDIDAIVQPLEGKAVSLADLEAAANAITQLYLGAGYLTSSAVLTEQVSTDGIVTIQLVEGRLADDIVVEGLRHLDPDYVRSRLRRGGQTPLNAGRLEQQLRLLRSNTTLFDDLSGKLQRGQETGTTQLTVTIDEATPLILGAEVNNYSSPSGGSERASATLGSHNLIGMGDRFTVEFDRTFARGLTRWDIDYELPLNAMDGSLRLGVLIDRNEVVRGISSVRALDFEGESEAYEISFRQPIVRSLQEEFALSLGVDHRQGRNSFISLADPNDRTRNENRITAIRFGQDYVRRDVQGAWSLRSQFSFGQAIQDLAGRPEDDSQFFSWLGQIQRVQRLGRDNLLIAALELQLTPDSLFGAEDFSIGGGQSLRGYRQAALSGDNGLRFSIEDRIRLGSSVQIAPFVDLGTVWNSSNSDNLSGPTFLAGAGLGVLWEVIPDLEVRLDYGIPLVELETPDYNLQDDGFYFSVRYRPF